MALVLVVLAVAVLVWQQPWRSQDPPASAGPPIPADASARLIAQFAALSAADSREEFVAAAGSGPAAQQFGEAAWQARVALDVGPVQLRYVSGGDTAEFDDGDTLADVEVSWSDDDEVAPATVGVRLRPMPDGTFDVVSAGAVDGQLPVWLAGDVEVESEGEVTVVRLDGGDPDLEVEDLAATARDQVTDVAEADGALVVVSPAAPRTSAALLGQQSGSLGQIAAVSTSFDLRHGDLAGPAVVLNPDVFDTMDRRAAQIVMTHEATHVLTGAVGTSIETWVSEGFADFVALRDDTASLTVSAGQVLAEVRDDGPPEALPGPADFDGATVGLGAVYESTWLVFRMLGEEFSETQVVGFYRDVLAGESIDAAAGEAFGLDTAQITARWRSYLTNIASMVS